MDQILGKLKSSLQTNMNATNFVIQTTLENRMTIICQFCEGLGHKANECPTKKELDKFCKDEGLGFHWGDVKSKLWKPVLEKRSALAKEQKEAERVTIEQRRTKRVSTSK